jgi:exosome complex exonuclease RRP6
VHGQVLVMAVEITFVPVSQRNATEPVEDSIVAVGHSRQKKRKRTKYILDDADPSGSAKSNKAKLKPSDNEIPNDKEESFGFSAVPNILDNNPDLEDSALKKKRKHKSGKYANQ